MSDFAQAAREDYLGVGDTDWVKNSDGYLRRFAGYAAKLAVFLLVMSCLLYPVIAIGFSAYLRVL